MLNYDELKLTEKFFLIAGPCMIENEDMVLQTAEYLRSVCKKKNIKLIFKASYLKANRTSLNSPAGVGLERGLQILQRVRSEYSLPILTDVHETVEIDDVMDVADVIQIPAFLSRQTRLITAAAATGKIINIKKAQFMTAEDIGFAAEKALSSGNEKIILTERGTSFGYNNLIVDFRNFGLMQALGYPVVFDVTHSLQRPSQGGISSGDRRFASDLARAALATGRVKGLFIETHPRPELALSDAATQIPLNEISGFLDLCLQISNKMETDRL